MKIIVELPTHLRVLANVERQIHLDVSPPITQRTLLDTLEREYPTLCGTIRERGNAQRRRLIRFFACGEDLSHESPDAPLPIAVATGREPFIILGAIAGG